MPGEEVHVLLLEAASANQWLFACDSDKVRWVSLDQDHVWHGAVSQELGYLLQCPVRHDGAHADEDVVEQDRVFGLSERCAEMRQHRRDLSTGALAVVVRQVFQGRAAHALEASDDAL